MTAWWFSPVPLHTLPRPPHLPPPPALFKTDTAMAAVAAANSNDTAGEQGTERSSLGLRK